MVNKKVWLYYKTGDGYYLYVYIKDKMAAIIWSHKMAAIIWSHKMAAIIWSHKMAAIIWSHKMAAIIWSHSVLYNGHIYCIVMGVVN